MRDHAWPRKFQKRDIAFAFRRGGRSFAGKFWGGYARGSGNYAKNGHNQLMRRKDSFNGASFILEDYFSCMGMTDADVVYCDPPYQGTTKYYSTPNMEYAPFWELCRVLSTRGIVVLISSYEAPFDFQTALVIPTKTSIRNADGVVIPRVERVFIHDSAAFQS